MKKQLTAAALAALAISLSACGAQRLQLEVPDTTDIQFSKTTMEDFSGETSFPGQAAFACAAQLPSFGAVTLYALQQDAAPNAQDHSITTVDGATVLNSSAAYMGEHGSIRDLAEAELYRWISSEFTEVEYAEPVTLSQKRMINQLTLKNESLGMRQFVIYTDMGSGMARIDRVWRSYALEAEPAVIPKSFWNVISYLASDQTLAENAVNLERSST